MPAAFLAMVRTLTVILSLVSVLHAQDDADLVHLVLELVADEDKDIRALAYEQIRNAAPGSSATERFSAELPKLSGDAQVGLLSALADRGDATAKPAVLQVLQNSSDAGITTAALTAMGPLGNATDTALLVKHLSSAPQLRAAARSSLIQLRGGDVDAALVAEWRGVDEEIQVAIIETLASRRAVSTIPHVLKWALSDTATIRRTAMTALGQLASADDLAGMLRGVLKATRRAERAAAEKCVMLVAEREEDPDQRALPILAAMKSSSSQERLVLLSVLGRVGGSPARKEVEAAIHSRSSALHAAGVAALSNWPNASVASRLMELAKRDQHASHRLTALRALIRIAPLPDGRSNLQKLQLLKTAMQMSRRDEERKLALQRASAIRIPETLRFVLPYLDQPKYAEQACATIVELAHDRQLRDNNKVEFHRALDRVLDTSRNATVRERADRYKQGQTWVRPKK